MMAVAAERLRRRQGKGAPARRSFAQAMVWSEAKGVQTQPTPFPPMFAPFITGLDPFKAMAMSVTAAKRLRCRQGQGGASTTISLVIVMDL